MVAGALRYQFLKVKIGSDVVFDINDAVSLTGNTGSYLQYAHARARGILAKSEQAVAFPTELFDKNRLCIIGKGGQEVDKLKEELKKITGKDIQINIFEIKRPELDVLLVVASIARQIENRISYRRAIKMAIAATMRMNAEGIKIQISGR